MKAVGNLEQGWQDLYLNMIIQLKCEDKQIVLIGPNATLERLMNDNGIRYQRIKLNRVFKYSTEKYFKIMCCEYTVMDYEQCATSYYEDINVVSPMGWTVTPYERSTMFELNQLDARIREAQSLASCSFSFRWENERRLDLLANGKRYVLTDFKRKEMRDLVETVKAEKNKIDLRPAVVDIPVASNTNVLPQMLPLVAERQVVPVMELLSLDTQMSGNVLDDVFGDTSSGILSDFMMGKTLSTDNVLMVENQEFVPPPVVKQREVACYLSTFNKGTMKGMSKIPVVPGTLVSFKNLIDYDDTAGWEPKVVDEKTKKTPVCHKGIHDWSLSKGRGGKIKFPHCKGKHCGLKPPLAVELQFENGEGQVMYSLPIKIACHKTQRVVHKNEGDEFPVTMPLGRQLVLNYQDVISVALITEDNRVVHSCKAHSSTVRWKQTGDKLHCEVECVGCETRTPRKYRIRVYTRSKKYFVTPLVWIVPDRDETRSRKFSEIVLRMGSGITYDLWVNGRPSEVQSVLLSQAAREGDPRFVEQGGGCFKEYQEQTQLLADVYALQTVFEVEVRARRKVRKRQS
jgi:hypothetical protein